MLSVFSHRMSTQNGIFKNQNALLLSLVSCLLSGENESRKLANTGKLAYQM